MLVAVCSLKGSPGVTTLATALGAYWPGRGSPTVIEVDPAGGDLVARFRLPDTPGLVSLAAAARGRGDINAGDLAQHTQVLLGRLRVVPGPVGAEQARAAVMALTSGTSSLLRSAAKQPETIIVADCGRVEPDAPTLPIIRGADAMLLVARARDADLAHVALKLGMAQQWSRRPCFVLVGGGYSTAEVSRALGIPVMGRVPDDARGAAVLGGQDSGQRTPAKSQLGRASVKIALNVIAHQPSVDRTRAARIWQARPGEVGSGAGRTLDGLRGDEVLTRDGAK